MAEQSIAEACVGGGKVRLRTSLGEGCVWRDDKAIATPPLVGGQSSSESVAD